MPTTTTSTTITTVQLAVQLDACRFVGASAAAWANALTVHIGLALGCLHVMGLTLWWAVPRRWWGWVGFCLGVASGLATLVGLHFVRDSEHEMTWMASFLAATFGFHAFFKNMATSCGTYPNGADKDLKTWILWYTSLPEPHFCKGKLVKSSLRSIRRRFGLMVIKLAALTALMSTSGNQDNITPILAIPTGSSYTNYETQMATLLNSYCQLWWLYLMASFCMDFGALLVMLQGAGTEPPFANPLLQSRSYRDAWSDRWNRPVHLMLKRSVYKPLRHRGVPPLVASIGTFLASGLLHEYNFFCHNYPGYHVGRALLFFAAMGLLMILEHALPWPVWVQRWAAAIPTPLYAILLQSLVLPIFVPLFFQSWVSSGMMASFGGLVPHWECLPVATAIG